MSCARCSGERFVFRKGVFWPSCAPAVNTVAQKKREAMRKIFIVYLTDRGVPLSFGFEKRCLLPSGGNSNALPAPRSSGMHGVKPSTKSLFSHVAPLRCNLSATPDANLVRKESQMRDGADSVLSRFR